MKPIAGSKTQAILTALLVSTLALWWYFRPYPWLGIAAAVLSGLFIYFVLTTLHAERHRRVFSFGLFAFVLIAFIAIIGANFGYLRSFAILHLSWIQYYYPNESPGGISIPCNRVVPQLFLGRAVYLPGMEVWEAILPTSLNALLIAFIPLFAIGLFFGRGFCSWICPFGGLNETMADGKKERWSLNFLRTETSTAEGLHFAGIKAWVKDTKYAVLAGIILISILLAFPAVCVFCPILWFAALPGLWIALGLVAVFAIALPLLNRHRWWCQICPLGALLSLTEKISLFRVRINKEKCIKCLKCARECRMFAMTPRSIEVALAPDADCIRCNHCAEVCPTGAIDTYWAGTHKRAKSVFIPLSVVVVLGWLVWFVLIVADKLVH